MEAADTVRAGSTADHAGRVAVRRYPDPGGLARLWPSRTVAIANGVQAILDGPGTS